MVNLHEHLDDAVLAELRDVLGDEFPVLVTTFLTDSQARLVAIRRALAARECDAVREAAHSFKGSALNLGAHRLANLCRDAENHARAGALAPLDNLLAELDTEFGHVAGLLDGKR